MFFPAVFRALDATARPIFCFFSSHQKRSGSRTRAARAAYIYKVLKQVHPDTGISKFAMQTVDDLIYETFRRIW